MVRSVCPARARAASARPVSRDRKTTFAPFCTNNFAMASPMPIEAPVTTATFPLSSMTCFYSVAPFKSTYEGTIKTLEAF